MAFVRDLFTGELKEITPEGVGRHIIARESLPYGDQTVRRGSKWIAPKYERECRPMSIKPEEATPERVAEYNEEAKRHGTGARYAPDGRCITSTRGSQNREMRRRNMANFDAGFGDYAGK